MIKRISFLVLLYTGTIITGCGQPDPAAYFRLDMRMYHEAGEQYLGVSPEIRPGVTDPLGRAIARYPRRFRYLLSRTDFQNKYEKFYPDTNRINRLYAAELKKDAVFMSSFSALAAPFLKTRFDRTAFTRTELMQVAARFFYCDGMNADSSVRSFICINLNGVRNAGFKKNMTLAEAFCFEAIFENYYDANGKPAAFVNQFRQYIREAEKRNKHLLPSAEQYVASVRNDCFAAMENNAALLKVLLDYWQANRSGWVFDII
ncbi:hypothetical protein [Sediminibacterium ginsengisoli]|uniref:Lipoprotein n=1 Tax=Sediminibacterium ginsengisoli TaxID=413434 RepID=A0A1T4RFI8_9BACT|nr:hypothetical protein [Sediminibacterium ginsengisoli]SKA14508.1 hypothetical protein SAMN04488132_1123 [Sediminibacterium ginsengisoli]